MDTQKIHATLLGIAAKLKTAGWKILPEYEIQLKSEGKLPLTKKYPAADVVGGAIDANVSLYMKHDSDTEFYPEYELYANISIEGVASHDILETGDCDVMFTDTTFNTDALLIRASAQLNTNVKHTINRELTKYVQDNADAIETYHSSGDAKADL